MSVDPTPTPKRRRVRELFRYYGVSVVDPAAEIVEESVHGSVAPPSAKELGAYYTDVKVAEFLVRWAIASPGDRILDPSSGDGVFLAAAARRVSELGGESAQVTGIEIDELAYRRTLLRTSTDSRGTRLINDDFFKIDPTDLPAADVVVGNPPFIRYQRFSGQARSLALRRASEEGVRIPELASAWAPFVVHAVRFIKPSGRLGMVIPAELAYASYARPVLKFLLNSFRSLSILTFARRLFPDLSEDAVLLLAEGKGEDFEELKLIDLPDASALPDRGVRVILPRGTVVDANAIIEGRERLPHYLLPEGTRRLYRELRSTPEVASLGDLATVGIGYVTGDNDFFHVSDAVVSAYDLPDEAVRPAALDGSYLRGIELTEADWTFQKNAGRPSFLLHILPGDEIPQSLAAYLAQGVAKGVPNRYKCRVRSPWYSVPHVYEGDALLTYMSGSGPRLVANGAGVVAPNTLHVVRLLPTCSISALALATYWQTSLTALSCEMEGHGLGGGMLKLEPGEARRVSIALPAHESQLLAELPGEMDHLLRQGKSEEARRLGDRAILREELGLSEGEIRDLGSAHRLLLDRRQHR